MGLRGPAPKPRDRKILEGTFRKDRDTGPTLEPTRLEKVPPAPRWLSKLARKEWKRIASELVSKNALSVNDIGTLEGYCASYGRAVAAEQALADAGTLVMVAPQGMIPRPEVNIAKQAWAEVRSFAAKLGATPADRTRVRTPDQKPALVKDPWAGLAANE